MADRSSFRAYVASVSWLFGLRVSDALDDLKHTGPGNTYEFRGDTFEAGDDRYEAAAYALYRRACRKHGDPVGEFQEVDD